jgi:two-component system response regulator YesN
LKFVTIKTAVSPITFYDIQAHPSNAPGCVIRAPEMPDSVGDGKSEYESPLPTRKAGTAMPFKVFLVEDEIVTRENIRDNVNWEADGFEFCGEAPDGEVALPLLQAAKPDVLITDIKMPFMDGLALSKIVRERMPAVKIVVLSGHDEFGYAQQAIKLGIAEYLLKPVSAHDLHQVLQKLAVQLEQEKKEHESIELLWGQIDQNQAALREQFLLKIVVGAVSPAEAEEQSQLLGLNLTARWYLIVVVRIELCDPLQRFNYPKYEKIHQIVHSVVGGDPDIFLLKKDLEELVLIFKANTRDSIEADMERITNQIKQQAAGTDCQLVIGCGSPEKQLVDIPRSFIEAVLHIQKQSRAAEPESGLGKSELLRADKPAVEEYLQSGTPADFDKFFDTHILPLGRTAIKSYIFKVYLFMEILLTTARFVIHLDGDINQILPEFQNIETVLSHITTIDQIRDYTQRILYSGLAFRERSVNFPQTGMIDQAKEYINRHYMDSGLSLGEVAAYINHSPSHFSTLFSQVTSQTFKEYITNIRLKKAKELLRSTAQTSSEIAYQVGYIDPHYFSSVFKKNTGLSPKEYRNKP